jgi:Uma2 family endonuclease
MRTLDRTEELTVTEYQQLIEAGIIGEDERVELWEGYLRDMSPVGAIHSAVVGTVTHAFYRTFADRYLVRVQDPIVLSNRSQPQPDVILLRLREDNYISELPTAADVVLLVEVSDSTLAFDLGVKVPRYAKAGVPEVWIIDANAFTLTQFQSPQDEIYTAARTYQRSDTITTLGTTFSVSDLLR